MEVTESSKPGPISALRQGEEEAHAESNVDHHFKIIELFHTDSEDGCRGSSLFLPELQRLSLADNKIASEEALIAAALFPKLCELDIHSNPLITHIRGDMPLLTYLQERLGIKVKRKMSEDVVKLPQKLSTYPGWKFHSGTRPGVETHRQSARWPGCSSRDLAGPSPNERREAIP
ncbi:hypothetical protein ATANTOWER_028027 [Ataeniobius toweri]|uniref:Uncharacterized protein n=1 Tax=Ataeniobius toweri TaxID=208326 RepID=A0ABU7ASP6_9TELE|nr:hypothetical protein [Ataeniobius toweri]